MPWSRPTIAYGSQLEAIKNLKILPFNSPKCDNPLVPPFRIFSKLMKLQNFSCFRKITIFIGESLAPHNALQRTMLLAMSKPPRFRIDLIQYGDFVNKANSRLLIIYS